MGETGRGPRKPVRRYICWCVARATRHVALPALQGLSRPLPVPASAASRLAGAPRARPSCHNPRHPTLPSGCCLLQVSPVDAVSQSFIPALFGHAVGDTFIKISHAEILHSAYAGDKNLIR